MTSADCTGTALLSTEEAGHRSAELGIFPPMYGRSMCGTCDGIVIPGRTGQPRQQLAGCRRHT